jgi:RND superfamily putative drug exporter
MYIEEYSRTGNEHQALYRSFMNSSKVIVAAFVVMFAIFVMFVPDGNLYLKPIALCLAVGVLADAVLIRMMLMPAVDKLVGKRAFILPKVIDRYLPHIDIEGKQVAAFEAAILETQSQGDLVIVKDVLNRNLKWQLARPTLLEYDDSELGRQLLLALAGRLKIPQGYIKVNQLYYPFNKAQMIKAVAYLDLSQTALTSSDLINKHTQVVVIDGLNFLEDKPVVERFLNELQSFQKSHPNLNYIFGSTPNFDPELKTLFEARLEIKS